MGKGEKKSPCDFTRPLTAKEKAACSGIEVRKLQYFLTGMPYVGGAMGDKVILAEGMDLHAARAVSTKLSQVVHQYYPGSHFYNAPMFGMDVRFPSYIKNGKGQVGDLILRNFTTPPRETGAGCSVYVDTNIVGQIMEVGETGTVVAVRDRTGVIGEPRNPYFIFPADQFDMSAALASLNERDRLYLKDGSFGAPRGSYTNATSLCHVLREYLWPLNTVMPTSDAVSSVMGHPVDMDAVLAELGLGHAGHPEYQAT